jgi:hypothetical protein
MAAGAGIHTVHITATETSAADEEGTDQLVVIVEQPHAIGLSASRDTVVGQQAAEVTLTLTNLSSASDRVALDIVSLNPTIGFTVLHNGIPLQGAVSIAPQASQQLTLVVQPHEYEHGVISMHAVSELDPNAAGSLTITVVGQALNIFLPLVAHS